MLAKRIVFDQVLMPGMRGLFYQKWQNSFYLYSPEFRQMRAKYLETFTVTRGADRLDVEMFLLVR